jgi:4-amino-4-deoxy-L-arabinose transferase-like glycosyltransferase
VKSEQLTANGPRLTRTATSGANGQQATAHSRQETVGRLLVLILVLNFLLGATYAVITPVFEASDELWHYPMVRHLADGNPLPVQVFDPAAAGPWKQQASQPPLYYYLGAALTFWIDTGDMARIRRLNPHVNPGTITADGNVNLVVHDPAANPWQGTLLAVRIVRLASVLLGAATVLLTYLIAREVAPGRPEIALGAAAVNAFLPMFLFISGAVNNDNLVIPLASWALLLMMRAARTGAAGRQAVPGGPPQPVGHVSQWPEWGRWILLGTVIGLAALAKISGVGLLFLAFGTIFLTRRQMTREVASLPLLWQLSWQTAGRFLLLLTPVVVIAGWWYYRNLVLYGDWSGWNAFMAVLGQRPQPASLAQLWSERSGFLASYWGLFGGLNVPMAAWIYPALNMVLLAAVAGFPLYLYQLLRRESQSEGLDAGHPRTLSDKFFSLVARHFPLLLCLLWSAAIIYGLIQWATLTWSSQGRLVFTAISALTTLFVLGLAGWLPRRPATIVLGALALWLFVVAAAAPFAWIRPAYQLHRYRAAGPAQIVVDQNFGGQIRLAGYTLNGAEAAEAPAAVWPGDVVELLLEWEVLAPMERDWSVFVHLNDPVIGAPIAQRDMYLDHGLRPASLLRPGERIFNRYHLAIPPTAVAPADLTLAVGLYDFDSRERLTLSDGGDAAVLTTLPLAAVPGAYPNPQSQNFGNELELVGFQVEPRRAHPGDSLELTLFWQPLRPLRADYTFFAQVVDLEGDLMRWSSADVAPVSGTGSWRVEQVETLSFSLPLAADTPPKLYPLIIGVYTRDAGGAFHRLQLVTADGRVTDQDYLLLTQVRVEG